MIPSSHAATTHAPKRDQWGFWSNQWRIASR